MPKCGDVWIGNQEADCFSCIVWIAENQSSLFECFQYALITWIDSGRAPRLVDSSTISKAAHSYGVEMQEVPAGILLSASDLVRVAAAIFNGFDEVWFFKSKPADLCLPNGMRISRQTWLRECSQNPGQLPDDLIRTAAWMESSGAVLGLADGTSLDYITNDHDLALSLESMDFSLSV